MKRLTLLALLVALLAAGTRADVPAPEPGPAEALRHLRRDLALVEGLVQGGIDLAAEDDPLIRASYCNRLADRLTRALREAVTAKDPERVAELGLGLRGLLETGVAGNILKARPRLTLDPQGAQKLQEFDKQLLLMQEELDRTGPTGADMQPALSAIRQGRAEVEKALRDKDGPKR